MILFDTINGVPTWLETDGSFTFVAPMMIDDDGSGPSMGDPDFQPHTSYQQDLDAEIDRYIVLPPQLFRGVVPMVLGCQAFVLNVESGLYTQAVVGDVGPASKIGEASIATALAVGVPASPTSGGIGLRQILYRVFPGVAAVVQNRTYRLQPFGS